MITGIFIAPGCKPAKLRFDGDDYDQIRSIVGGGFSASRLADDLSVYYHDEGLLEGLPPNLRVGTTLFAGNLLVTRVDDEGSEVSTTDADFIGVCAWHDAAYAPCRFEYDIPGPFIAFGGDMEQNRRDAQAQADAAPRTTFDLAIDEREHEVIQTFKLNRV